MKSLYVKALNYPKSILSALFLFCVVLGLKIPDLDIDASSDSLILQNDPAFVAYEKMGKAYHSREFLVVAYTPSTPLFSNETFKKVEELKGKLAHLSGVDSVLTYLDVPLLYSPKVRFGQFADDIKYLKTADLNLARKEFKTSPLYQQLVTSMDEKTTAIVVNLTPANHLQALKKEKLALLASEGRSQAYHKVLKAYDQAMRDRKTMEAKLIEQVRQITAAHTSEQMFIGGVPMIVSDMLDFLRSDMLVFGIAIVLFIIALLWIIFRRLRWVLLPILTCLATGVVMLGGIGWLGIKLTILSANFIAILLIITLSITVHLIVRFIEEEKRQPKLNQKELVAYVTSVMIKPCFFTTLTTVVAFMSLVMSDIKPVIDFGWMMTAAVSVALVLSFLILPAGLLITRRHYHEEKDPVTNQLVECFSRLALDHTGKVMFVSSALVVAAVLGVTQLKVENRFIDNFSKDTEIYQGMLTLDKQLGGTLPLSILLRHPTVTQGAKLAESEEELPDDLDDFFANDDFNQADFDSEYNVDLPYWFTVAGLETIEKAQDYLAAQPDSGKVLSLATLYKVIKDISGEHVDNVQLAIVWKNMDEDLKKTLVEPYLSDDGDEARISARVKETSKSLNRQDYLKNIQSYLTNDLGMKPENVTLTGIMVLYNNLLQSLFSSQIKTLGAVFFAIMLMFGILFRSVKLAFIGVLPNLLAAGIVLGLMGIVGIPLDIMTITIAAITLGIGVDDTIHYLHRFKRELVKHGGDYRATINRCHHSTGLAMFYTSVTIIFGFSILTLSNFTPSIYFGLLTSLAMSSALLGALILLPATLLTFKPIKVHAM